MTAWAARRRRSKRKATPELSRLPKRSRAAQARNKKRLAAIDTLTQSISQAFRIPTFTAQDRVTRGLPNSTYLPSPVAAICCWTYCANNACMCVLGWTVSANM